MRTLQTVAALACLKTLLLVFNVLFWVSGIILLIVGIWLHVELHRYMDVSGSGGGGTGGVAPYLFVVTGLLILFLGTLGCCCNVAEQPLVLYIYACLLSLILALEATGCALAYSHRTELSSGFEHGLNESMQVYNVEHGPTSAINLLQTHVNCCGLHGPADWYRTPYGRIPGSCCVTNMGCDTRDRRAIHREGCAALVTGLVDGNVQVAGYTAGLIGLFQALGICLAIVLGKLVEKTKYEQIVS